MKLRKTLSMAGALAAAGAFALTVAPSAAATPTGIQLTCASGSSQLGCSVAWRDADGRVHIRWAINGRHLESADDQSSFRIACIPGDYYAVTVTVGDSTGRASASARVQCQRA